MNKFVSVRVWGHGLSHPIYVAQDLQDVQILLSEGKVPEACIALWRRASLGSDAAAALLGYMNLRHVVPGAFSPRKSLNAALMLLIETMGSRCTWLHGRRMKWAILRRMPNGSIDLLGNAFCRLSPTWRVMRCKPRGQL